MSSSKNIYIHIQIAEILRGRSENSALTITEITEELEGRFQFKGTRKTVDRNLGGMSNDFKLSSIGERPSRYWIEDFFEPDIKIGLNPYQIQLITYALRNLRQTASKPLKKTLNETEAALFQHLPKITKDEIHHALKLYEDNRKAKPSPSWPKNNLETLFLAIRKNMPVSARLKISSLSEKERQIQRKLRIQKLWFEDGTPIIKAWDHSSKTYRRLVVYNLNGLTL